MTSRPTWSRWVPLVGVFLAVLVAVFVAFFVGTVWLLDKGREATILIDDPVRSANVVVSVAGAVATPGVYELPGGSRVQHALDAAGGILPEADLAAVNPAVRLQDGEQIVIPAVAGASVAGAPATATVAPTVVPMALSSSDPGTAVEDAETDGVATIDINAASQAELEQLPGIGPAKARAIIAYRDEHGPFETVEELAKVEGISEEMVADLSPYVRIGP
jgi:competence protein ComEA